MTVGINLEVWNQNVGRILIAINAYKTKIVKQELQKKLILVL